MTGSNEDIIDDVAYLSRSEHRVASLVALSMETHTKSELSETTGVSSSTIRRTLREFEDRQWIQREGSGYRTTQLGSFVAGSLAELVDRLETERSLRDVWQWLPGEDEGLTIEMCSDAVVTVADADNPYRPVNRFKELLREADEFRFAGFDVALFEPSKDELCERVIEGMDTELITPPRVAKYIRSTCPDLFSDALESGNLAVRLHDSMPPFGVSIFTDRIAISGYDPDSVTVRVLVDTDGQEARDWAETIYRAYRRQTPTIPVEPPQE